MMLTQRVIDEAVALSTERSARNLGIYEYCYDEASRPARQRWRRMVEPGAQGYGLAALYVPAWDEDRDEDLDGPVMLSEELPANWDTQVVLLPVRWRSAVDPLTLGLKQDLLKYSWELPRDADVAQAVLRFPHVDAADVGDFSSPIGSASRLSQTPLGTLYVWSVTPCSEDEASLLAGAYAGAELSTPMLPPLAYDFNSGGTDPVSEVITEDDYNAWVKESVENGQVVVCRDAHEDDLYFIDGNPSLQMCGCCGYWSLREWMMNNCFVTVQEYTGRVRELLGPVYYDEVWNEAVHWLKSGVRAAHDMAHMLANEGGPEWCSWWESRYLPERCSGGASALPLAQQRFARYASSA